ncbi:hypothetical protein KIN20_007818 [Parelaphostrongylus tenuis]|uniref:Uncharacterized protein n=1 Tax=Parelaphostrongylus tenuis TaxID=148309 RepID=A0AAD5QMA9_PARTN|nr:hypothetical protein KIN20_007818 [Parelaphostrongylus tenuis]
MLHMNLIVSLLRIFSIVLYVKHYVQGNKSRLQERFGGRYEIVRVDEQHDSGGVLSQISFTAFGRVYVVIVNPDDSQFDLSYRLTVGEETATPSDRSYHYRGHLKGNRLHSATLSRIQTGVYVGSIYTGNDSIYIEPAIIHQLSADERDLLVFHSSALEVSRISETLSRNGLSVPLDVRNYQKKFYMIIMIKVCHVVMPLDRFISFGFRAINGSF